MANRGNERKEKEAKAGEENRPHTDRGLRKPPVSEGYARRGRCVELG